MSRTLNVCLLALTAVPALGQRAEVRVDSAVLEVRRGRVQVLRAEEVERTLSADERVVLPGSAHVEVGAGSQVRLAWPGRASMDVWGPASLQWETREDSSVGASELDNYSGGTLDWHLFDVAWVDLEVRRGNHVLHLPGAWRGSVGTGAFHLRGLPSGPLEVRHHAGSPMTLTWVGDESRARPPITVYSGSSVRLDRPADSPADESRNARAWDRTEWPWRDEVETPAQARRRRELERETSVLENARDAGPETTVAKVKEFDPETRLSVERSPEPVLQAPRDERASGSAEAVPTAPQETRETEPERPADAESEPVTDAPTGPNTAAWRGLDPSRLNATGPLSVERAPGVEVRVFASGRRKVFVDVMAPGPAWCFAPKADYLLHPGSVVVFEDDGSLRMKFGKVDTREALPGRVDAR